jgi:hypothetical protein
MIALLYGRRVVGVCCPELREAQRRLAAVELVVVERGPSWAVVV